MDMITFTYSTAYRGDGILHLYSSNGILLKSIPVTLEEGENYIPLDISNLAPAAYVVEVVEGSNATKAVFIKQ